MSKLICPIRGQLNINEKAKDGKTSTEEKLRIDLINILLSKNYNKDAIYLEEKMQVGSKGSHPKLIDLAIKDGDSYLLVAEVKRDDISEKEIKEAILYQLQTAIDLKKAKYGIFYNGSHQKLFYKGNEYNLSMLPNYGEEFKTALFKFDELVPIQNAKVLFDELDLIIHSLGYGKNERYKGLFQVILAKYYDEQFHKHDLKFTALTTNIAVFEKLWADAYDYYQRNFVQGQQVQKELIFKYDDLQKVIKLLQPYSFIKSKSSVPQDFFMKFSSKILDKINMAQYYTPVAIIDFIVNILDIKPYQAVIDPAGGSADFLTGVIQKYKNNPDYKDMKDNLYYWDISKDACSVAFFNMVLNGDGRTKIHQIDSIANWNKNNSFFDFVITNPPFGSKVKFMGNQSILKHYKLNEHCNGQLGVLFIERAMNLLKENGILAIVLPSGYLNNQQQSYIRKYLIDNFHILADISFPEGVFKGAETGVKTDVLFVKKTKRIHNYKIFTDVVKNIGFDFNTKNLPPIYKINDENGEILKDANNEAILNTDLPEILKRMQQFAYDEKIIGLSQVNHSINYGYTYMQDLDSSLKLKPELSNTKISLILNDKSLYSLREYKQNNQNGLIIEKKTKNFEKSIIKSKIYSYIPIAQTHSKGLYTLSNKLRGWQIQNISRAKQIGHKDSIYLPYLYGSYDKFFYFNLDNSDVIISNGFYRIYINDEKVRYSFFKFLFDQSYQIQFQAFATGHIQTNIIEERILDFRFKLLDKEEINQVKQMIKVFDECIKVRG
ncbi:HsdM family class I SAM-dependent methyltransferase [Mycoplasma sp. 246B]